MNEIQLHNLDLPITVIVIFVDFIDHNPKTSLKV